MKKITIILLVCVLCFLTACSSPKSDIKPAREKLIARWEEIYNNSQKQKDGHFEIINTRVIVIKENDLEDFKDVKYIIEFVIFSDYNGSAPYYSQATISNSVVVYKNGEMKVPNNNPLKVYSMETNKYDYSDIIKSIKDYGNDFNITKKLKIKNK
ncbi:MAG: hypothetical protein J6B80_06555 [Clostridia bacterium]|nr:hypothetical protein [Clostridia bacterium]